MVSFLQSVRFGVQGDSISAITGNAWQNVVIARTGMTLVNQDARAGRRFDQAFECYGTTTPGSTLGVYRLINGGTCIDTGGTVGNTLAQNLANVDLEFIQLGTNDFNVPLGALGDDSSAGTFYGNMRWVVENYLQAKPTLRLVMITVQYNAFATAASSQARAEATVAYGKSMGVPVIDMFSMGGNNAITAPSLTLDGTHPTPWGFAHFYGPVIAQSVQEIF